MVCWGSDDVLSIAHRRVSRAGVLNRTPSCSVFTCFKARSRLELRLHKEMKISTRLGIACYPEQSTKYRAHTTEEFTPPGGTKIPT